MGGTISGSHFLRASLFMTTFALLLHLGEIPKAVRSINQGKWATIIRKEEDPECPPQGRVSHTDHEGSVTESTSVPWKVSDLRDDGVLVLPQLPSLGFLLVTQQLRSGNLPRNPGLDKSSCQGPETLLPSQHPRESVS